MKRMPKLCCPACREASIAQHLYHCLACAGTWEGIQAAKQLEDEGVATHIILVYRRVALFTYSATCAIIGLIQT